MTLTLALATVLLAAACEPKVLIEAPREPIVINLNIKLDMEVRHMIEKTAKEDIKGNPDIF
ncbi:MAG: YnbE family lipoprotein [Rhodospirillales bacterium]